MPHSYAGEHRLSVAERGAEEALDGRGQTLQLSEVDRRRVYGFAGRI